MSITLAQVIGPAYTRIYSFGAARGENAVPNEDLIGPIDSSDEWIRQRTGIITRARANKDTDAIDLATEAAAEAIEKSGVPADQVDLVIVATISNPKQTPSVSAIVADRVGANPAAAYDINAACAGYAYAIAQADALIKAGAARYALVIGTEKLSDVVDPTDRSISFLLGDGAGAALIGPSDTPGIAPAVWGSDGSKADAVGMNGTLTQFRDGEVPWPTLRQEGQTVFRWAVWEMAKVAREALDKAGCRTDRHRRLHPAPGEHAHHRRVRQAAEAAGEHGDRPRHRDDRQHVRRVHPAREPPVDGRAPRAVGGSGAADRLRRRARVRRTGRRPPLSSRDLL